MDTIFKSNIFEEYFLNFFSTTEHFKKDKKPTASNTSETPQKPKTKKGKVYHHKAGTAKSEYSEDFKNDKNKNKTKISETPEKPKTKKGKVYHHKAGSAKSEYTEDFTNSKKKIYIMFPKNSFENSVNILIPK